MRQRILVAALILVAPLAGCTDPVNDGRGSSSTRRRAADVERDPEISVNSPEAAAELPGPDVSESDWPWWRGPLYSGMAGPEAVPVEWSEKKNIVWKAPVPGRGHSSPTVVGDRVFLETAETGNLSDAEDDIQSVLCYSRADGSLLWKSDVHTGGLVGGTHPRNTWATPTVASDGERVFAVFFNRESVWVTAVDLEGNQLWQTEAGRHVTGYGYAASPVIYQSFVIVAADNHVNGFLAALHRGTGEIVWRKHRPLKDSYASPVTAHVAGRDQLFLTGCDIIAGYDPRTGESLWSIPTEIETAVCTMSFDGTHVYASGGYPGKATYCIDPESQGSIVWQNSTRVYEPSMIFFEGHLYAVTKEGVGYCWNAATSKQAWRGRVGGQYSASPVLAGGNIYITNEQGTTTVFKATPERFEKLAENPLGDETFPTLAVSRGQIFLRAARTESGQRQETLYCIGTL